jgi:hypothetical protein
MEPIVATQPVSAPVVAVPPPILSVEPASDAPGTTTSPVVEALASSAGSSKKGTKRPGGSTNKKVDCTPPYFVDENRVKHMKPECK